MCDEYKVINTDCPEISISCLQFTIENTLDKQQKMNYSVIDLAALIIHGSKTKTVTLISRKTACTQNLADPISQKITFTCLLYVTMFWLFLAFFSTLQKAGKASCASLEIPKAENIL